MALKAKAPEKIEKRMKVLFYGRAGVGKTTASIQFPKPYVIDTERGAENDQYVKLMKESGAAYMSTADPDELIAEVKALIAEKHDYRTLVIDPLTTIYNDLLDKGAEELGTDFGKHKGPANRKLKHLLALLLRLDMNVIVTSHAKPKWVRGKDARGKDTAMQEGMTFDCYDGLDYLFDLVFEVDKRGLDRVGIVRKSRIETFQENEIFPFSYDAIAEKYGRSVLERGAVAVAFASPEQIAELKELCDARKDGEALLDKWLDKAKAANVDELPADVAGKCIDFLKKGGK